VVEVVELASLLYYYLFVELVEVVGLAFLLHFYLSVLLHEVPVGSGCLYAVVYLARIPLLHYYLAVLLHGDVHNT
jgi:hypothetical protein